MFIDVHYMYISIANKQSWCFLSFSSNDFPRYWNSVSRMPPGHLNCRCCPINRSVDSLTLRPWPMACRDRANIRYQKTLCRYDSTLDFDDSIPEEAQNQARRALKSEQWNINKPCMPSMINIMQVDETLGFYETFGPVFRSNARWSTRCPVLPGPARSISLSVESCAGSRCPNWGMRRPTCRRCIRCPNWKWQRKSVKIERKTDLARSGSMFPVDLT